MFSNHPDAEIQVIIRRFWEAIKTLAGGKSTEKCSFFRFQASIDVINNLRFLLNIQWPQPAQQNHLLHLELLIKLIENLQQAQILLEGQMSAARERQMRAIYFMTTRNRNSESLEQLAECLLFFADLYLICRFPFIPMQLSVAMLYCIKEKIRFFKRNNSMQSINNFMSSLDEFPRDGLEEICFSEFLTMPLRIIPTRPYLHDLFLSNPFEIDLNSLVLQNNDVLLRYPTFANIPLPLLNIVMAILAQVREERNVNARLKLLKIEIIFNIDTFESYKFLLNTKI